MYASSEDEGYVVEYVEVHTRKRRKSLDRAASASSLPASLSDSDESTVVVSDASEFSQLFQTSAYERVPVYWCQDDNDTVCSSSSSSTAAAIAYDSPGTQEHVHTQREITGSSKLGQRDPATCVKDCWPDAQVAQIEFQWMHDDAAAGNVGQNCVVVSELSNPDIFVQWNQIVNLLRIQKCQLHL